MKTITVTLSSGKDVKVHPVPPYIVELRLSRLKKPVPPRRKINPETAIPGVTDSDTVPDEKDPEYQRQLEEWVGERANALIDTRLMYGLREEFAPADWPTDEDRDQWEWLGVSPEIPSDKYGRKLAWIKYGLLQSPGDMELVMTASSQFNEARKEDIEAILDSFRDKGKGN